jgi:hypothetical protein
MLSYKEIIGSYVSYIAFIYIKTPLNSLRIPKINIYIALVLYL